MSTFERKFRYDSTSQDGQRLTPDNGGADWDQDFDYGAIRGNHINDPQYQKAGKGFENPRDGGSVAPGAPDVHYDHIDFPWNRLDWPAPVKPQPSKYSNPAARADKSDDTRASYKRARASCSNECLDGSDEASWYGAGNKRQE
jgi:hypothetical protein